MVALMDIPERYVREVTGIPVPEAGDSVLSEEDAAAMPGAQQSQPIEDTAQPDRLHAIRGKA
jgi:phage gp29-like protein